MGVADQRQGIAAAGQVVVDAAQHQVAAPALRLGGQFVAGQPARADDAVVEGAFGMVAHGAGGEAYALVGDAVGRGGVQVDAGNGAQLDLPAGFLEGFAQGGLKQAFGGLQVPGGLVQHLAAVGLFLSQPCATLSGGERLKAALALVLYADRPAQLLLLDEPDNHLDLAARQALESMLGQYRGALLVVSHDPVFLRHLALDGELRATAAGWRLEDL